MWGWSTMANLAVMIGVGVFLAIIVGIGLYVSRWIRGSSENFIVAGRNLILPLAAATLMAQSLDANATLGNTDLTSQFGFWAGASLPIGLATCLFLTGLFFAKPLNNMDLLTIGDFFRVKYGRAVEIAASITLAVAYAFLLAGNLVAGGFLFQVFLGTTFTQGVLIIAAVIFLYTIAGGLLAVAYTDILQAGLALLGSLLLLGYVAIEFGIVVPSGMGATDTGQLTNPAMGAYVNWATLAALGLGDVVASDFIERVLAADSPETARTACFLGSAGTLVIGIPFTYVALSTESIFEQLGATPTEGDPVLYELLGFVPIEITVLVLIGIVGASLSTGDGAILSTSSVVARNVLNIRIEAESRRQAQGKSDRLLRVTRLLAIPFTVLGVLFAIGLPQTGILLVLAFDLMLAGLFVPFAFGMYWEKANTAAALGSIATGFVARIVTFIGKETIYGQPNTLLYIPNESIAAIPDGLPTFISFGISLVVFIPVAYITQELSTPEPLPAEAKQERPSLSDD
jgi:SSS family solute:Na+ symporter